jgi:ABC-2 type transport system ATP-binding protein
VLGRPIHLREARFALRDVDLDIAQGESVAIIGANGSGKSTLLRVIAGIYTATAGTIETRGRIAAVIELGAGFHPELTGLENIHMYAAILGLPRSRLATRLDEIVEFAGMGDHLDTPLKYYSSGMVARLAFSVAICVESDILLLDEVLAVGDVSFREKCLDRIQAYREQGKILIHVTHSAEQAERVCSRAIWLDQGRLVMDGAMSDVVRAYNRKQGRTVSE